MAGPRGSLRQHPLTETIKEIDAHSQKLHRFLKAIYKKLNLSSLEVQKACQKEAESGTLQSDTLFIESFLVPYKKDEMNFIVGTCAKAVLLNSLRQKFRLNEIVNLGKFGKNYSLVLKLPYSVVEAAVKAAHRGRIPQHVNLSFYKGAVCLFTSKKSSLLRVFDQLRKKK